MARFNPLSPEEGHGAKDPAPRKTRTKGARAASKPEPKPAPQPAVSGMAKTVLAIPEATFACLMETTDLEKARKARAQFAAWCSSNPGDGNWRTAWRTYKALPEAEKPETKPAPTPKPTTRKEHPLPRRDSILPKVPRTEKPSETPAAITTLPLSPIQEAILKLRKV